MKRITLLSILIATLTSQTQFEGNFEKTSKFLNSEKGKKMFAVKSNSLFEDKLQANNVLDNYLVKSIPYLQNAPKIKLSNESELYLYENDIAYDQESYRTAVLLDLNDVLKMDMPSDILMTIEGDAYNRPLTWSNSQLFNQQFGKASDNAKALAFCINKKSFDIVPGGYSNVKQNVMQAVKEWEGICGVKFQYKPEFDERDNIGINSTDLNFVVRLSPYTHSSYVAVAFLPGQFLKGQRDLTLYKNYFTSDYDKVGVFRHEIGHILGLLHEQYRAGRSECNPLYPEQTTRNILLNYDSVSVMHYPCAGLGSKLFKFSKIDSSYLPKLYPR